MQIPPRIFIPCLCMVLLHLLSCDSSTRGTVVETYHKESVGNDTSGYYVIYLAAGFQGDFVSAAIQGRSFYLGRLTSRSTTEFTGSTLSLGVNDTATLVGIYNEYGPPKHFDPSNWAIPVVTLPRRNSKPLESIEININGCRYTLILRKYRQILIHKFPAQDSVEAHHTNGLVVFI